MTDSEIILHTLHTTVRVTTFSWHTNFHLGSQTLFKSYHQYRQEPSRNYSSGNFLCNRPWNGSRRHPPPPTSQLKVEQTRLESFHENWNHYWSSWAWRCRCNSQSWDDGFNQEICVSTLSPQNRNVKICVIMKTTVLVTIMRVMRKKMVMRMILMFWMVRFCKKTLQVLSR